MSNNYNSMGRSSNYGRGNPRKRGLGFQRGRGGAKRARGSFSPIRPKVSFTREDSEISDHLRLTEKDVGIIEYMNNLPGFNGVIKQRFSDFLVNELKPDGSVVHLTNFDLPAVEEDTFKPSADEMTDVLPQETWDRINALLSQPSGKVEIQATERTKEERRFIHQIIKKVYKNSLTSNTTEQNGKKYIMVGRPSKDDPRRKDAWPENRPDYVHFALYKENMDTMEAVNLLASKLFLRTSMVTYAGTKDRRAKTCQRACVKRIEPKRLASAARSLRGLSIGNFEFQNNALQLGQLGGNRFQIILRNVTGTDEQIEAAMTSLKKSGFLNYYGLQRFGTQSVPTHHIGRALLQGNWKKAVELILKPRGPGESPALQEMREMWWKTRDSTGALKMLQSRDNCIEGQLLTGLIKSHKNDTVNALESIPRNTRLMYLHSYQSYIWNEVLSKRVKELGYEPVVGDLVLAEDAELQETDSAAAEDDPAKPEEQTESEVAEAAAASRLPAVKMLTEADLSRYTIHDVVLPLPGFAVTYPGHAAAGWYEELMAKDDLSSASLKQNVRKYSLGGTYRRIAVLPSCVSWKTTQYSDATKALVQSDLDVVLKRPPVPEEKDGIYKALVLDFCLPSSTYATMALREVLKCDTSARHQSSLNSYNVPNEDTKEAATSGVEEPLPPGDESYASIPKMDPTPPHKTNLQSKSSNKDVTPEVADAEDSSPESPKDEKVEATE